MIISYSRQFVFIHIHKTGGDSIAAALAPGLRRSDIVLKNDFQQWLRGLVSGSQHRTAASQLRKHSTATDVRSYLSTERWEQLFTFAFVRHPVSRAISLYSYAKIKAEERRRILARNLWYAARPGGRLDPRRWSSVIAYNETDSFSEFLTHPLVASAPAMQPQWPSVCDESRGLLVDFVGRFEDLISDFDKVQARIGISSPLPWRNSSSGRSGDQPIVTNADRALLAERFSEDFTLFGYDPEMLV